MSFPLLMEPSKKFFLAFEIHNQILKYSDIAHVFPCVFFYQGIFLAFSKRK